MFRLDDPPGAPVNLEKFEIRILQSIVVDTIHELADTVYPPEYTSKNPLAEQNCLSDERYRETLLAIYKKLGEMHQS